MEEPREDMESSLKYYSVFKEYEYVFEEFSGFPPKRDIYYSISLIFGATPTSNIPYRMSIPELK
jgi:hypothetical protein